MGKSDGIAEYLLADQCGPFAFGVSGSAWNEWEFENDGREGGLFKQDWHALPHISGSAELFIPRHGTRGIVKQAPPRLCAFLQAFREANQLCWDNMRKSLRSLIQSHAAQRGVVTLAETLVDCLQQGGFFAVVEAQVRTSEVAERGRSHRDGSTSLLHLSITLKGHRTLRIGSFVRPDAPDRDQGVWEEDNWSGPDAVLRDVELSPGDIYISSPSSYHHGLQFQKCSTEEPMVALQCRLAFQLPRELGEKLNHRRNNDMLIITDLVSSCLKASSDNGDLRLPSIKEAQACEARASNHAAT